MNPILSRNEIDTEAHKMKFQKKHRNDSPTIHGLSQGAMRAIEEGKLSEIELAKVTGLSCANVRKYITGEIWGKSTEWHHVNHNGRIVEMAFGELPDAEEIEEIKAEIKARKV